MRRKSLPPSDSPERIAPLAKLPVFRSLSDKRVVVAGRPCPSTCEAVTNLNTVVWSCGIFSVSAAMPISLSAWLDVSPRTVLLAG